MLNKNNILRFLIVVLFLSTIAIAAETTWRHSGFEISGFDMNGSSTYNLTEIRKIEFGWNTSIPEVSDTSRAVMYYDDNQKRIMQSVNGGAYQAIVDNTTVNAYTVNAANATGVLPNASIPLSAMNRSMITSGTYVGDGTQNRAIAHGMGITPRYANFHSTATDIFIVQMNATWQGRPRDEAGTIVTAWDSTNIYVGGSGGTYTNNNGATFDYVIIGS